MFLCPSLGSASFYVSFAWPDIGISFEYGTLWLLLMVAGSENLIVRWVPLVWTSWSYTNTWSGCQPLTLASWGSKTRRKDQLWKGTVCFLTVQPFIYGICLVKEIGFGFRYPPASASTKSWDFTPVSCKGPPSYVWPVFYMYLYTCLYIFKIVSAIYSSCTSIILASKTRMPRV